jgi:hypothetical protein
MQRYPKIKSIQDIGNKLIRRIERQVDDEIQDLLKETAARIEKQKLKLIAENEEEVKLMADSLNEAMAKEEQMMNEQLDTRKNEIMRIKKKNLEDRLKLAKGEMSEE